MSAWNPVDDWFSAKKTRVEVLSRIGPITIDDFLILSDWVRFSENFTLFFSGLSLFIELCTLNYFAKLTKLYFLA